MFNRKNLFFLALVILAVLLARKNRHPVSESPATSIPAVIASAAATATATASPVPRPVSDSKPDSKTLFTPPRNEDLYGEVQKDPHRTPPTLIKFAAQMGAKMETAMKSESAAAHFFKELQDCVLDSTESRSPSVQALCLINAHDISKKYPSMEGDYQVLLNRADSETLKLARAVSDL